MKRKITPLPYRFSLPEPGDCVEVQGGELVVHEMKQRVEFGIARNLMDATGTFYAYGAKRGRKATFAFPLHEGNTLYVNHEAAS